MEKYDLIVVGGGILVRANPELGMFCPTHETWPETVVCEDLNLERGWPEPAVGVHRNSGVLAYA